jgi:hypothetical protein
MVPFTQQMQMAAEKLTRKIGIFSICLSPAPKRLTAGLPHVRTGKAEEERFPLPGGDN